MATFRSPLATAALAALCLLGTPACLVGRSLGRNFSQALRTPLPSKGPKGKVATQAADAGVRISWIGHATVMVQIGDKTVLTDPVFTRSVGQLASRRTAPGLMPAQLPHVDAVVISHMHFDHLSLGSLDMIEAQTTRLFVPRGGIVYIPDLAFDVQELDRWEAFEDDGLRITAVPVNHVGFRYGTDAAWMTDSFTGYVIEYKGKSVYFAGDTTYDGEAFRSTHARFPNLDLALLPIAPVEPRQLMKATHVGPREALQAFLDLGARTMIPIHFDTFVNSTDHVGDAPRLLEKAMQERGVASDQVRRLEPGELCVLPATSATPPTERQPFCGRAIDNSSVMVIP